MNFTDNIVKHRKNGDFQYLTFKRLDEYSDKLTHGITLRHGGVSKGIYESLNLRNKGRDNIDNVKKNVKVICDNLGLNYDNVYKAEQAHTDNILVLDENNKLNYKYEKFSLDKYDAYITKDSNISTFITTADCNPIIIYDTKKNIIANIHAGWKGVVKQIYLKTIIKMVDEFGSCLNDLIVCIGPSIRKCCFSSEDEQFKKNFTNIWNNEERYIEYENGSKRFHIDLIYLITKDLLDVGIPNDNIQVSKICTCCNDDDFFSYRKYTKEGKEDYATFSTWVSLK